jgi:hypothetical protein
MNHDNHDQFEYDVALSFAGEDKEVAEEFASLLSDKRITIFYDEYQVGALWGEDLVDHLVNIYSRKARYCVMFISQYYPLKKWTEAEQASVQELALRDANEYIIAIQLDNTLVPGISETPGYRDLRRHSMESIVNSLEHNLKKPIVHPGPPPESHDLRSGNIPSTEDIE